MTDKLPMKSHSNRVLAWSDDLDGKTWAQAERTAAMDFVEKPVALMPDAHLGLGATVGSVIATSGAIMPAAVGVDIGCGMIAQKLRYPASDLNPHLDHIHQRIARVVPSGIPTKANKGNGRHRDLDLISPDGDLLLDAIPEVIKDKKITAAQQLGTLGSGNHFVEVCEDEQGGAWVVLHSGSRGAGNLIARHHIDVAKGLMKDYLVKLEDPDLAFLVQDSPQFNHYIEDLRWAQRYAFENRQAMMTAILLELVKVVDDFNILDGPAINCHHNYTEIEHHHGKDLWVTRKGAIRAREGDLGVIPGSMATGSFIVSGLGNRASYTSASHGAGRKMSRTQAKRELTTESLMARMEGISWNRSPQALLDEHPEAYKDLGQVMENQKDLVQIEHRLTTRLNYKGA